MILPKIDADIVSTKKKVMYYNASVILLPQGSKFSVAQLVIYILLLRNLTIAHFTFINTLIMLDTYPLD